MYLRRIKVINWKSFADSGDIELGRINVLVGRNNSGKSALLRAINLIQGGEFAGSDVRLGSEASEIRLELGEIDAQCHFRGKEISQVMAQPGNQDSWGVFRAVVYSDGRRVMDFTVHGEGHTVNDSNPIQARPENFIYTYLSKRKVTTFDRVVELAKAQAIAPDLRNLVSKVDELANADHVRFEEYTRLCEAVIGFRVSAVMFEGGKHAGIPIKTSDRITIEAMGEGASRTRGI